MRHVESHFAKRPDAASYEKQAKNKKRYPLVNIRMLGDTGDTGLVG